MSAALMARARQVRGEQQHQAACAEFRRRRQADEQARINALLLDLVHALASLPLDRDHWPNQHTASTSRAGAA